MTRIVRPSQERRPEELFTLHEAAAYLHRKPCTLYRWRLDRRNKIPTVNIAGRLFYRVSDLDEFIRERAVTDFNGRQPTDTVGNGIISE